MRQKRRVGALAVNHPLVYYMPEDRAALMQEME